jgi:hypothetical protein
VFRRLTGLPDEAILGRRPSETGFGVDAALIERVLARQVIAEAFRWSTCTWSRPSPSAPAQASWRFRRVAVREAVTTAKIVYKVSDLITVPVTRPVVMALLWGSPPGAESGRCSEAGPLRAW